MRRAAKVDANHGDVVSALEKAGVFVVSLAAVGDGLPDLLCWKRRWFLVEIKDGSLPPSARRLTPKQEMFHAICPGEVHVVESVEAALAAALRGES